MILSIAKLTLPYLLIATLFRLLNLFFFLVICLRHNDISLRWLAYLGINIESCTTLFTEKGIARSNFSTLFKGCHWDVKHIGIYFLLKDSSWLLFLSFMSYLLHLSLWRFFITVVKFLLKIIRVAHLNWTCSSTLIRIWSWNWSSSFKFLFRRLYDAFWILLSLIAL